jgi:peptidoglycan/LPS O-acetylase OafA/YrhL
MREFIAFASFAMAVLAGLAAMFLSQKDRQTMASIVAGVFLISFFLNAASQDQWMSRAACLAAFAVAVCGGVTAIFGKNEARRTPAIVVGSVALGTSLLILVLHL